MNTSNKIKQDAVSKLASTLNVPIAKAQELSEWMTKPLSGSAHLRNAKQVQSKDASASKLASILNIPVVNMQEVLEWMARPLSISPALAVSGSIALDETRSQ